MTQLDKPSGSDGRLPQSRLRILALALGGLLLGLFLSWGAIRLLDDRPQINPPSYRGVSLSSNEPVDDFTLTSHTGQRVSLSDFSDKITLLFFGYTHCPDICPVTLATLTEALAMLDPDDQAQVQVLFITVDPQRDTPQHLADFLVQYDSSILGLSGSAEEIADAAASASIYYQKRPSEDSSSYLVDHTASVVLVDKNGRQRLTYPYKTPAEDIAADLRQLLRDEG